MGKNGKCSKKTMEDVGNYDFWVNQPKMMVKMEKEWWMMVKKLERRWESMGGMGIDQDFTTEGCSARLKLYPRLAGVNCCPLPKEDAESGALRGQEEVL